MRIRQLHSRAAPLLLGLAGAMMAPQSGLAQTAADYIAIPPLLADGAPPNVMLVMSNDHELYKKAYSDYSDLDGDGELDQSYNDSFTYSGYFDSQYCYDFSSTDERFEPVTHIGARINGGLGHGCSEVSGSWSGNFLNWASMTRIDIVRAVLYGGRRVTDSAAAGETPAVTELERTFLPEDSHSFVKVFSGEVNDFTPYTQPAISLCNTTYGSTGGEPLLRVAYGSWPQWSASEVVQCHYRDEQDSGLGNQPGSSDRPVVHDYEVRVLACMEGLDATSQRCKAYFDRSSGDTTYKPVGLLQRYGDNGAMNFGLMTGSYNQNISGGVLRKNIMPLVGNTDPVNDEIDTATGQFINDGAADAGIINTLNRLRIVNWDYSGNHYDDCDTYSIDINTFKTSTSENRQCRNWGNPLSEIYLEAVRYFSGDEVSGAVEGEGVPTSTFDTSDADQIASLPQLSWEDPLRSDNACATCSIIIISTGLNSFDKDELASVTDLWDVPGSSRLSEGGLDSMVDLVGDMENISGNDFLIGNNGTINNNICTSKTVDRLSQAMGLCPEIPQMEGGFDIAGLAFHARTTDLRDEFEGIQNVRTFSVALAESLPSFELDVNGESVTFVPTCQAHTDGGQKIDEGGWSDCSLVDVIVESSNENSASLLIAWEDSHWGNDYDMDGIARLEYCVGADVSNCPGEPDNLWLGSGYSWSDFSWRTSGLNDDSVQFRVSVPQAAAGNALRFGYIVSGVEDQTTSADLITNTDERARNDWPYNNGVGQYIIRETLGNGEQPLVLRRGNRTISRLNANSGNPIIYTAPAVYTVSDSDDAGRLLKNPLWYAAKYGSFNDLDNDGTPWHDGNAEDSREWDARDTRGESGSDGLPDNYFPVRNPTELTASLSQIFETISERVSSGTAAAVVANSSTGLGGVYQAYFQPRFTDRFENSIAWGGVLHSMFIDESGRFREDNGTPGTLDDTDTDYVIDVFYDQTVVPSRTRFQRYTQSGSGPGATLTPLGQPEDLENLNSIWNARDVLGDIPQGDLPVQRGVDLLGGGYTEPAQDKRYILTHLDSIDSGTFGEVDSGELVDFTASTFDPELNDNHRYLALPDPENATHLVNWVRGQDQPGWRSRRVDLPGDGDTSVKHWILGDIVHSSPLVVSPPDARYDIRHGDETYAAFKQQYAHRRQMIYTGANDGMLHAFNGGVWDPAGKTFHPRGYDDSSGDYTVGLNHQLGAEMWAYVPMNLLPHLQWLRDPDYEHIYYMDGPPASFDVNIFTSDDTHPGGWGTILVAGMRLGGGPFPVDLDGDDTDETVMRSAFIILDVTDPEKPPELIAELVLPDIGFTTSEPVLVKARRPSATGSYASPSTNRWMLVFGSGPDQLSTATSSREAQFYAYDLVNREMVTLDSNAQVSDADPNGFFGDLLSVDWDNDYLDDAIYAGTVEGSEFSPGGRLKRLVLDDSTQMGLSSGLASASDVIDVDRPISAAPATRVDVSRNERWLLFGTGRLFTRDDNQSTPRQAFYGVKEAADFDTASVTPTDLVDTSAIVVTADGAIHDTTIDSQVSLDGDDLDGMLDLQAHMDDKPGWVHYLSYTGTSPAERVFTRPLVLGNTVVFTSYLPSMDICTIDGSSFLNGINFRTGTADVYGPFGVDNNEIAFSSVELGAGASYEPNAVVSTGDDPLPGGGDDEGGEGSSGSSGGGIGILTSNDRGTPQQTPFTPPPGSGGRISWEILEIPF